MFCKNKKILLLFFFFLMVGCAHRSGEYIQTKDNDTWKSLSKKYGISAWKIKASNSSKKFAKNNWIFIPQERGIMSNPYAGEDSERYFNSGEFIWPVPSSKRVSSEFGKRWGRAHEGIDISAPIGTSIIAAASGVVVYSGSGLGGYGNLTVISHKDGFFTIYAHARRNYTKKGQKVHKGQVIAKVGMTGRTSGPHLHFELRHESKAIDPMKFSAFRP